MATASCGRRVSRALRLLLLLALPLTAVEYLLGSVLDASLLRSFLHPYNATQSSVYAMTSYWSKRMPVTTEDKHSKAENVGYARNINLNKSIDSINNTNKAIPIYATVENIQKENSALLATKTEDGVTNKTIEKLLSFYNIILELSNMTEPSLPLCEKPPDLGPISANKSDLELDYVETKYPEVDLGGQYAPSNCTARHRVAIIVPFRDRKQHLAIFLNHMHPFLMKQQIEYGIFIIEQYGGKIFNRAKLMNVGFLESQKQKAGGWQCFIFHDIDLLPLDQRNMYTCPEQPRHMSALVDKFDYKLPYQDIFGGVSAMTLEQFTKVNGFSNKYWGWGGEDDDMFQRFNKMGYHLTRYDDLTITKYAMLNHQPSLANPNRYQLLTEVSKTFQNDGLSTLEYKVVDVVPHHLYTHVIVNIDEIS